MHASTPAQAFARSDIVRAGVITQPTKAREQASVRAPRARRRPSSCWRRGSMADQLPGVLLAPPQSTYTAAAQSTRSRAIYTRRSSDTRVISAGHGWWATRARPRGSTVAHPLRCPAFPLYYPPYLLTYLPTPLRSGRPYLLGQGYGLLYEILTRFGPERSRDTYLLQLEISNSTPTWRLPGRFFTGSSTPRWKHLCLSCCSSRRAP